MRRAPYSLQRALELGQHPPRVALVARARRHEHALDLAHLGPERAVAAARDRDAARVEDDEAGALLLERALAGEDLVGRLELLSQPLAHERLVLRVQRPRGRAARGLVAQLELGRAPQREHDDVVVQHRRPLLCLPRTRARRAAAAASCARRPASSSGSRSSPKKRRSRRTSSSPSVAAKRTSPRWNSTSRSSCCPSSSTPSGSPLPGSGSDSPPSAAAGTAAGGRRCSSAGARGRRRRGRRSRSRRGAAACAGSGWSARAPRRATRCPTRAPRRSSAPSRWRPPPRGPCR